MIDGRIVKNFSLKEMMNSLADEDVKLVLNPEVVEFAQMMQELRDYYGKPMNVNSWYRTKSFNRKIGGDPSSIHLDGRAADIAVTDYENLTIAWKVICQRHGKIGGVNYYPTFMHFDNFEDKFGHKTFQIRDYRKEK